MLYLAQVTHNPFLSEFHLQILAYETSEKLWKKESGTLYIESAEQLQGLNEGVLVLVEMDNKQRILSVKSATDWVLDIVQKFLSDPILTPEIIQQEEARIEQWRQEIAAKSLDLTRKQLEIETQREQIQAIEASFAKA
ncbi:MAG: hypothetical protein VKJ02_13335 [Snowella sp.]|nr:hypothetical protein [Snowella sp.]